MDKNCYVKIKSEIVEAEFIGVFQHSQVIDPSPMIGGHPGGVIAFPVGVVKLGEELLEVRISAITFKQA
ncbi:hypothetical protein MXL46_08325 [Heyndrickxia sporothermodurans]|uniref:hypothetical protein n=1 Tax=Heyndrickxia sporothermodurans TaxID=46224 RepID=UPI002DB692B7|nr:hypothetical protein [Heyndrickxia sporothermodurans]MEB6549101.1 hypothetical protein [Heyndrickxia sporothermodurans]